MEEKGPHILRIAITGPECTGKSHLSQALAEHFGGIWVPEYAREYLEKLDRKYTYDDLLRIAKGHQQQEEELTQLALEKKLPVIYTDTELINIKIWSEFWYKRSDPWFEEAIQDSTYDIYFLMYPDIPWEPDPFRENPGDRMELFHWFEKELKRYQKKYIIISGAYPQRMLKGIKQSELFLRK